MTNKRPPTFAVLCAIARDQFRSTIDDSEWCERVKRQLVAQRWDYPKPHELTNAIRAVETALAKTGRRRSA